MNKPQTPLELADFYVKVGRQTGRTTALINALPSDGNCIIIIWSINQQNHFIHQIKSIRPDVNTDNIQFSYSRNGKDIYPPIYNKDKLPIYIDNAVTDLAIMNIFRYHNRNDADYRKYGL